MQTGSSALHPEVAVHALGESVATSAATAQSLLHVGRLAAHALRVPVLLLTLGAGDGPAVPIARNTAAHHPPEHDMQPGQWFADYIRATRVATFVADASTHPLPHLAIDTADCGFHAYAGAPMMSGAGAWLGSICAYDTCAREWTASDHASLEAAAATVVALLPHQPVPLPPPAPAPLDHLAAGAVASEHVWLIEQLAAEHGRLEAVLQQLPAGVIIADAHSQRVISSNAQVDAILGTSLRDNATLGAYFAVQKYHPDGRPYRAEERPLARALHHGEIVSDEALVVRRQDATTVMARVSAAPIRDATGQIMAAVATITDVTDLQHMIDAQRFLAEAGTRLASSLDSWQTLEHVVRLAVPRLTDLCIIDLLDAAGQLKRAAAYAEPPHTELARALCEAPALHGSASSVLALFEAEQRSAPLTLPISALTALHDDETLRLLETLGPAEALVVPIVIRGQLLGTLSCVRLAASRPTAAYELPLLSELAQRAASAIEAAQLYEAARVSEARLRSSEMMFRTLAETVAAATFIFQGAQILYVNPAAERLTGFTSQELLALSFWELIALDAASEALANAPPTPVELRMRTREGGERWVQLSLGAMLFAGQPATISTAFDITERKRAERLLAEERTNMEQMVQQRTRELQLERDRTQAILEALGEAVIVTDAQGIVEYVNPAAVALTGWDATAMLAQPWEPLRLEQNSALAPHPFWELARAGQTWCGEVSQPCANGATVDTALTVAPLFTDTSRAQLRGFVGVQRDITPLKVAERLKDQFISNVSHELRTPLAVITLFSGNLERSYELLDSAQRRRFIHGICEQTQVLDNLINGVLEIARIDSRCMAPERSSVELSALLRAVVGQQQPLARKKGQHVRLDGAGPIRIQGNDEQLRQVFQNLISNAIKYTGEGGRIRCTWRVLDLPASPSGTKAAAVRQASHWPGCAELAPGLWAAVKVTDSGIGIAESDQARIFERFYRVKAQSRVPGTGLGLAIVQELVQLHGGSVAIRSTIERGSTFAVYLPLAPQA